jgi:hypothetical protein
MLKKITLLAMAIAAIAAFATPSVASADWTHEHAPLGPGQNPHVLLEGTWEFNSETLGGISCHETTMTMQLTGGTTTGHVKNFTAHNLATQCTVSGFLAAICGENSLTSIGITGEFNVTITGASTLDVEGIVLHTTFGECLSITLSGDLSAEVDNGQTISNATLEGTLDTGGFGEIEMDADFGVTPDGTYGIDFQP